MCLLSLQRCQWLLRQPSVQRSGLGGSACTTDARVPDFMTTLRG
jgi:hypothetical protein